MYNVILDDLADSVIINGTEYPVRTDFKSWLEFNRALLSQEITPTSILSAFNAVLEYIPDEEPKATADALIAFMNMEQVEDKDPDAPVLMRDVMEREEKPRDPVVLDYDFDAGYIFAGFVQQYGINLREVNLHWYEFRALFNGLSKDTKIIEIIGYRAVMDAEYSKMSKSERAHIKKMKEIFALPDRRTKDEIENDFANGL